MSQNHALRFDDSYYQDVWDIFEDDYLWKHSWDGDINTTNQKLWKDENDSSF